MQTQRTIALTPGVSRPLVAIDDDIGYLKTRQSRRERNPTLTSTDDQNLGLD